MKTMLTRSLTAFVAGLVLASPSFAVADDQATEVNKVKLENYKGTVTAADPQENSVTVRGLLTTRKFNAADNCKVAFEDKPDATLSDLRPGQKVAIAYYRTHGVRVAREITQRNRTFQGCITSLDPEKRTLGVKHGLITRQFNLAEHGAVLVADDKSGTIGKLNIGDTVEVIYRSENEPLTAQRIVQRNPTFTGQVRAIDAVARTVTARNFLTDKKFHLANGCKIVIDGKLNGNLNDLRIGDKLSVSYEDADGVLVANRIGREMTDQENEAPQTAKAASAEP